MAGVFNGRKNIEPDGTGAQWQPNGNVVIDLGRYRNKRALATILTITGQIVAKVTTAPASDTAYTINYADDHIYNLFSNVQIKLNGNTEVKNVTSLAVFRFINTLQNRGKFEYREIPESVSIKAGQTQGVAEFKLVITIPFAMFDQIGATQTNICTWLFNSFQLTYKNEPQEVCFKSMLARAQGASNDEGAATLSLANTYVNCSSKYWITSEIQANTQEDFLSQMGNLYVQKVISKGFSGGGKGQYIELTPNLWIKDFIIVFRNSQTNERLDGMIDRIKIADGNNILVDTTPEILKNEMLQKFSLSQMLFGKELSDSPDGKGVFYGVYHIASNYFGDMNNSLVFMSFNQMRLSIDFNDKFASVLNGATEEILVEVYQNYEDSPQLLQQVALAEANRTAQAQG
ncbi:hypothetical protein [uncultured Helicobacter sp.]|uniref:hypothetical protein n=1 Tax=uncultured Helicobacter sp. TaxID=175537 RepID=UPI00261F67A1|nr:hypothetical protein [uncultured Helicobacter sp.]